MSSDTNRPKLPSGVTDLGPRKVGGSMILEQFALANGLRVLVHVDPAAPIVCLQTWMRVGSRHEKPGKTGISHLFEHLMFGETELRGHGEFDQLLEEAGAETNAATFLDWTYYHQNLPKDALSLALTLESERMSRLILTEPQVAREKDVVINERRQRVDDDLDGAVSEILYKTAFEKHTYRAPTIGWMEDIEGFTPEDCMAFYRTYYAPNNATLVIVGDVALDSLLVEIEKNFGPLTPSKIPEEATELEPPQSSERIVRLEKPTMTHKISLGYKSPGMGDDDYAVLVVLNEMLFGGRASTLHRALVRGKELASEARGWVGTFKDPALWDISLVAREGTDGDALLAAFDEEIARFLREPMVRDELDRAKARLELGTLQSLETVSGKAETFGFYDTVVGDPGGLFGNLEAYRAVDLEVLARVARRYLVQTARTIVMVAPSGEEEDGDEEGEDEEEEGEAA